MASDPCSHATDHWNVAALRRTSVEAPGPPLPAQGRPSVPSTNPTHFYDVADFQLQKVPSCFCNIILNSLKMTKSTSSRSTSTHWNMEIWMNALLSLTFACQIQIYIYISKYIHAHLHLCMRIYIYILTIKSVRTINIQQRSHPAILPGRWDSRPLGTLVSHPAPTSVVTSKSSERKSVLGVLMGGSDNLLS